MACYLPSPILSPIHHNTQLLSVDFSQCPSSFTIAPSSSINFPPNSEPIPPSPLGTLCTCPSSSHRFPLVHFIHFIWHVNVLHTIHSSNSNFVHFPAVIQCSVHYRFIGHRPIQNVGDVIIPQNNHSFFQLSHPCISPNKIYNFFETTRSKWSVILFYVF